jgi:hypothetical protein
MIPSYVLLIVVMSQGSRIDAVFCRMNKNKNGGGRPVVCLVRCIRLGT